MKNFEREVFNLLTKESGFYMKEYYSDFYNSNKWIGILDLGEAIISVIISNDSEEDINNKEANDYLSKAFNKPYLLNTIVLISGEYINLESNNYENKLLVSTKDKRIIYCSQDSKPLLPVVEYVIKSEGKAKYSIENIKKYKTTYILILVNIIIYLLAAIKSQNLFEIDIKTLIVMGAKVNPLINDGEIWRLITSAFLHGGIIHISLNMFALKMIGTEVEEVYGVKRYLYIYFLSAIGSSLLSYILGPTNVSVGASGAIFGLLGAMLVFAFKEKDTKGKKYLRNILQVIILNIVIGLSMSNIDNFGHLGGLIQGSITALILYNKDLKVKQC